MPLQIGNRFTIRWETKTPPMVDYGNWFTRRGEDRLLRIPDEVRATEDGFEAAYTWQVIGEDEELFYREMPFPFKKP